MQAQRGGKMTRKERERERHRAEILDAAERVFVSKGYQGATVEEIGQEAEFAVGTIYNFFASKEELFLEVLDRHIKHYWDLIEAEVFQEPDAAKAIEALIRLRLSLYERYKGFFLVAFEATIRFQKDPSFVLPEKYDRLYDQYIGNLEQVFARGIRAGQIDGEEPLYLALCLEGIINAFQAHWSRHEPEEPIGVRVEKVARAFLRRLLKEPLAQQSPGAVLPSKAPANEPNDNGLA